jgi:hypothetical protein
LRKRLWTNDTFVDFDHGVNIAINKLRDAPGDSPEKPRFIETLPRRGYRFIASVDAPKTSRDGEPPALATSSSPAGRAASGSIAWRRALLPALLALTLVAVFFSSVRAWRGYSGGSRIRSLAVLPLENLSSDPSQEYFAAVGKSTAAEDTHQCLHYREPFGAAGRIRSAGTTPEPSSTE